MTKVAILGGGLLGGSIALALRARGTARVSLWARRHETIEDAVRMGFADAASTDLGMAVRDASLVVLCTPIGAMAELAERMAPSLQREAIVTDVGSVKVPVVEEVGAALRGKARFVGSHPMAGSHETGLGAARADLFRDSMCIVTPGADADLAAVREVKALWEQLGARVCELTPERHDRLIALISHLPHLVAATLVNVVTAEDSAALDLSGPGFRDSTRIASGSPGMWAEIFERNREDVLKSTEAMIAKLGEFATLLRSADPEKQNLMN